MARGWSGAIPSRLEWSNPLQALALLAIAIYRRGLSPLLPLACRFAPSCSEYAEIAIRRHGLWRGGRAAVGRFLRCHPWHSGGYDPVP